MANLKDKTRTKEDISILFFPIKGSRDRKKKKQQANFTIEHKYKNSKY